MKKLIILLIASLAILFGCSNNETEEVTSITVWTNASNIFLGEEKVDAEGNTYRDESTAYGKIAADAWTAETGITVEWEAIPGGDNTQVVNLVNNDDPSVDVIYSPIQESFTDEQIIENFVPWYESEEDCLQDMLYCSLTVQSDGKIYGLAGNVAYNNVFVYNEQVLNDIGYETVPTDVDGFLQMLEDAKTAGYTPIALHRIENWPLSEYTTGASYVNNQADPLGDAMNYEDPFGTGKPMGVTQDFMVEIVSNGYMEESAYADWGVAMDSVAYGETLGMLAGTWVVPQIVGRIPEGETTTIGMAPWPKFNSTTNPDLNANDETLNVNLDINGVFWVPNSSDAIEESQDFVRYLINDIAFQTGVAGIPNVPGMEEAISPNYADLQPRIDSGEIEVIQSVFYSPDKLAAEEVLKDMGVFADYKYHGDVYDAAKSGGKEAAEQVQADMNSAWVENK